MSIMGLIKSPLDTLVWIRMTHVCHAWREILIGDPNLWTQISASRSSWVLEMLSRSRDMPLSVKVDFFDLHPEGEEAAMHALQQLPRIRELTLDIPNMGAVSEELIKPAPILESFAVQVYRRFTSPSLPEPLFAMIAPQLRRLSLENCQIPLNAPSFDKLTHLRLADSQLTLKISDFFTILRRLGNLVDLSLLNLRLSEHFTEADFDQMAPVEFPRLVKLVITEFPVAFLWNLRLPANPDVLLVFSYRHVLAVEQLEVAILSVLRCFTDLGVCTQALMIENTPSFCRVGHHPCDVPHEYPRFTVRLNHTLFSMIPRISRAFLAHPPIKDHLLVLKISGQRAAVVKQDMLPLKELRTLILDHFAAQEWLASMNRFRGPDVYPRLESIIFTDPVFSGDLGARALEHLVKYITSRIQSQCSSIKTLKLSAQELLEFTAATRLRGLVPEILFFTPE
ncbi:hypothetical protein D9615_000102 [Tricholomella constricta]|uniref:F-box domain-containing protein n=1 Tax=Tricholomella constricta TaxID=117010 RepID=A0A8H5MBL0_9AGAR|nr:hypothetical protein D9615_000102 [Tricholomella constricta]